MTPDQQVTHARTWIGFFLFISLGCFFCGLWLGTKVIPRQGVISSIRLMECR